MDEQERYWSDIAGIMLQAEMTKLNIDYPELSDKLAELRINMKPAELRTVISQGTFGAWFLIVCLKAMGVTNFSLDNDYWGPGGTG